MKFVTLLIIFWSVVTYSCNNKTKSVAPDLFFDTSGLIVKVYENSSKNIFLNGAPISKNDLEFKLIDLKLNDGIVFFSCSGTTDKPPDNSEVTALLKKYKLSVKMYSDSTFMKPLY